MIIRIADLSKIDVAARCAAAEARLAEAVQILEMCQDCILGERPEDMTDEDARNFVISRIRNVIFADEFSSSGPGLINRVISELNDRRLLNGVSDDLHREIASDLINVVRGIGKPLAKPLSISMDNRMPVEHTPTPWQADPDYREGYEWNIHIIDRSGYNRICFMSNGPQTAANAALIVKAVNNHAALVEALEELVSIFAPTAVSGSIGAEVLQEARAVLVSSETSGMGDIK